MGGKAGHHGVRAIRKRQKQIARAKAGWMRPMLEKENGWDLATDIRATKTEDDVRRKRIAVARITKKAVRFMFPECGCRVRRGIGDDNHWIHVNVTLKSGSLPDSGRGSHEMPRVAERKIKDVLVALGISYARNHQRDGDWSPCLLVKVQNGE